MLSEARRKDLLQAAVAYGNAVHGPGSEESEAEEASNLEALVSSWLDAARSESEAKTLDLVLQGQKALRDDAAMPGIDLADVRLLVHFCLRPEGEGVRWYRISDSSRPIVAAAERILKALEGRQVEADRPTLCPSSGSVARCGRFFVCDCGAEGPIVDGKVPDHYPEPAPRWRCACGEVSHLSICPACGGHLGATVSPVPEKEEDQAARRRYNLLVDDGVWEPGEEP